jgi:membrane fusion protein (multidrug efflux system)
MKIHFIIIAAIVVILSAGSYFFLGSKDAENAAGQAPAAGGGLPVTAMTVEAKPLDIFESLPGRTAAYKVAEIRPQVGGIITERLFEEGSLVKEGDQLYQIDPASYKAAYNSAVATLKKAQANVKSVQAKAVRYTELVIIEAVSKQEYDDVVASLDQAHADVAIGEAAVATAKVNLDYTKVYAPISGRIGKSNYTQGALVTANQTDALATITQLDPMYVDMTQSSKDVIRLRETYAANKEQGTPVKLTIDASGEEYAHEGLLQFSEVTVDETTGMVKMRAEFPNPDQILLPGLFVKASIKQGSQENAILVPQRAASRGPDGNLMVWVIGADGMVNPRPIKAEREIGDQWLVTEGLASGETIALDSFQKMQPGMPVTAIPEGAAAPEQGGMGAPPAAPADAAPAETTPVEAAPVEAPAETIEGSGDMPPAPVTITPEEAPAPQGMEQGIIPMEEPPVVDAPVITEQPAEEPKAE